MTHQINLRDLSSGFIDHAQEIVHKLIADTIEHGRGGNVSIVFSTKWDDDADKFALVCCVKSKLPMEGHKSVSDRTEQEALMNFAAEIEGQTTLDDDGVDNEP